MAVKETTLRALLDLGISRQSIQKLKGQTGDVEKRFHTLQASITEAREDITKAILASQDPRKAQQRLEQLKSERDELLKVARAQNELVKAQVATEQLVGKRRELAARGAETAGVERQIRAQSKAASEAYIELAEQREKEKAELFALAGHIPTVVKTLDDLGINIGETGKAAADMATTLATLPMDPLGAAVKAITTIITEVGSFVETVEAGEKQVTDTWTEFVSKRIEADEGALSAAQSYNEAQDKVQQAYEDGGLIAKLFVDRVGAVNAQQDMLHDKLVTTASDHKDYVAAVRFLNLNLKDGEIALQLMTATEFNRTKEILAQTAALDKIVARRAAEKATIYETIAALKDLRAENELTWASTVRVSAQLVSLGAQQIVEQERQFSSFAEVYGEYTKDLLAAQEEYQVASDIAQEEYTTERLVAEEEMYAELKQIGLDWSQNLTILELQTADERERIASDLGANLTQIAADVALERTSLMSSFMEESYEAEESYYKQRAEAAADFGLEATRMEEDHQKEMRRKREDSMDRQRGAIRSRDAIALRDERRDYEKDRSRTEEDYIDQVRRRNEDFALRLAQEEVAFRDRQVARQRQYEEQLAELERRLAEERAAVREAAEKEEQEAEESRQRQIRDLHDAKVDEEKTAKDSYTKQEQNLKKSLDSQLQTADTALTREQRRLEQSFISRRQQLSFFLDGEYAAETASYARRREAARAWMAEIEAIYSPRTQRGGLPGRQAGGYMDTGLYRAGEGGYEYALSHGTTRALESALGGRLTQAGVLGAVGGRAGPISFSQTNVITATDPDRIGDIVASKTLEVLDGLLKEIT